MEKFPDLPQDGPYFQEKIRKLAKLFALKHLTTYVTRLSKDARQNNISVWRNLTAQWVKLVLKRSTRDGIIHAVDCHRKYDTVPIVHFLISTSNIL